MTGFPITISSQKTQKALSKGIQTLYEATFSFDNIFVKNDLLHLGKKGWELYEVKMGDGD